MDFLRKNVFYVSLGSAVLIALILMMIIGWPKNDELVAAQAARSTTQDEMVKLTNHPRVNDNVLKNELKRNDMLSKEAAGSLAACVLFNSAKLTDKNDKSPFLRYSENEPVFPLDRIALKNASTYTLIDRYQKQLKSLGDQLKPIGPYTPAEANEEAKRQERLLKGQKPVTEAPAVVPGSEMGPTRRGSAGPGFDGPAAVTASEEARREAIRVLRLRDAFEGLMYVKPDAFEPYISGTRSNITPAELWWMQVNLWVQSDIVAAIAETNNQPQRKDNSVISSPVKHLIKIKVADKYIGASGSGVTVGAAPVDVAAPAHGAGRGHGQPMPPPDYGMPPDAGGAENVAGSVTIDSGASITGRTSCKNYDVVRYTLTVIMPTRYIAELQWNLMSRNYHTIINVSDISEVPDDLGVYYGNEPVMKVTMEGEALFLTAWERGTVDPKDPTKYIYPPLMPVEVLKTLPAAALRPEDSERIAKGDAKPK